MMKPVKKERIKKTKKKKEREKKRLGFWKESKRKQYSTTRFDDLESLFTKLSSRKLLRTFWSNDLDFCITIMC